MSVNLVYEILSALQFSPCLITSHHNRFVSCIYLSTAVSLLGICFMLSMFTMYHNDGDKEHEMIYSFVITIPFCFGQHKIVTMSDTEFQGYVFTFVQLFMSMFLCIL